MKITIIIATLLFTNTVLAWDGYDYDNHKFVEINKGNTVREGRDIEVYEYGKGYKNYEVDSINRYGSSVEVEVRDPATGESRTFDMDRD